MKIVVELTHAERTSIGGFLESIGLKESAESITKREDQCGVFRIKNRIDCGLTGKYTGTAECEEGAILDTVKILEKYAPLANSIAASIMSIYVTGKMFFDGFAQDIKDVIAKYERREPYGGFTHEPDMSEEEIYRRVKEFTYRS